MLFKRLIPTLCMLFAVAAGAAEVAPATTQPTKPIEGYRYMDVGSWIISEAHVQTNGTPATIKRKVTVTVDSASGQRAIEESRWKASADGFEPIGPAQPLAVADRRSFDELGFTPHATQPDQVLTIGRKRYVCSVSTYLFEGGGSDGRSTQLTLWRDKSGGTQLPPRAMSINGKEIPLPQDALQADYTVEGPRVSTKGQRRIVSLASPLRVNGLTCNCLVEATRAEGTSNDKPMALLVREWFTHDLPGERLRTVTSMSVGAMRVESDVTVLDFHVARLSAADVHAMPESR
jgi:hypothetical protein